MRWIIGVLVNNNLFALRAKMGPYLSHFKVDFVAFIVIPRIICHIFITVLLSQIKRPIVSAKP